MVRGITLFNVRASKSCKISINYQTLAMITIDKYLLNILICSMLMMMMMMSNIFIALKLGHG